VTFATPAALAGLLAVPLVVAWYLAEQRRRRAGAAAFAAPALQPSVMPRRPGWRRHAPAVALALALAVLIVAAARPQRTVAVPVEQASILLATDVSGSMTATDVKPTRLAAAKRAALRFAASVPSQVSIGVIAFNGAPAVLQSPTRDRSAVRSAIARMRSSGGTATGEAIAQAVRVLAAPAGGGRPAPSAVVLLSDGKSTRGRDPIAAARAAGKAHIPVYTVALGTAAGTITVPRPGGKGTEVRTVPPDPQALADIARASGARSFTAQSATGLAAVYRQLGSRLSHRKERRQVTAAFAGAGLALLLAGAGMSLAWFGRII
jgi:Ca-activated chloride channel family protein